MIADTHIPELLAVLPKGIVHLFQDVDLILHAGDVTGAEVLDELKLLAPVVAVKGDHDALDLPVKTVVEIGGARIGLIHGRRPVWRELPSILSNELFAGRRFWWGGFQRQVLRAFSQVEVIVFGHFHRPYLAWHDGVLLFCPGAVYHLTPEHAQAQLSEDPPFIRRVFLRRWLRRAAKNPTVVTGPPPLGLLTVVEGTIQAEVLPIPG
ncbi:MAG: metallophosphoesterase family protein [Chloroflexi bacterium]|nr:metallophosphoesterase family protein [Chloroflexota bacterium]